MEENDIESKQELLDNVLAVCDGCQEYIFKTVIEEMDYESLTKDTAHKYNPRVIFTDGNSTEVHTIPMLSSFDTEALDITKSAFKASMEELKEGLVITQFAIAANLILNLSDGISSVEEFSSSLKRVVNDVLFSNKVVSEMVYRSLDRRNK